MAVPVKRRWHTLIDTLNALWTGKRHTTPIASLEGSDAAGNGLYISASAAKTGRRFSPQHPGFGAEEKKMSYARLVIGHCHRNNQLLSRNRVTVSPDQRIQIATGAFPVHFRCPASPTGDKCWNCWQVADRPPSAPKKVRYERASMRSLPHQHQLNSLSTEESSAIQQWKNNVDA